MSDLVPRRPLTSAEARERVHDLLKRKRRPRSNRWAHPVPYEFGQVEEPKKPKRGFLDRLLRRRPR